MSEIDREQILSEMRETMAGREAFVLLNYPAIREAYRNEYGWPELDPVRDEACLCVIFGLYQAAITLTNHLLESLLKHALIYRHSQGVPPDKEKVKSHATKAMVDWVAEGKRQYGDKPLASNIDAACRVGLITKDQKKQLHGLREIFRNAYSHADKEKTFGDKTARIQGGHVGADGLRMDPPVEVRIADFPACQGVVQAIQAKAHAAPYFLYVDALAREVLGKLVPTERAPAAPANEVNP